MHGGQDRGAGQFEVAVARLAINGFRRRNGSRMTNNVATAQINSPSFSSSQNNSRSTSRILMDFLPSFPPHPRSPRHTPRLRLRRRGGRAKETLWEPSRRAVLTLFESAFRSWNNDHGRCRQWHMERGRQGGRTMMMTEGGRDSVKVRA